MKSLTIHTTHYLETHQAFQKRKIDEGKSQSHIQSVVRHSKEFLHYLESHSITDLNAVTQTTIDHYFDYLKHRKNNRRPGGLSNAYLEKHREAVFRFMEFFLGIDVGQTPFYIPKFEKERIPKDILTEAEIEMIFKRQDVSMNGIRNRAILSILYGCGFRKGELHLLNVTDIDMAKEVIRVKQSKTSMQRDVPMTPQVRHNIEAYLYGVRELLLPEAHQEDAFLLNNNGKRMSLNGIQHKVKTIAECSGIDKPITAHRLRHAIATHLLGDFTIEEIALFLGHRSIDSSQIYTHIKYTKQPKQL
mgnify:CR=1 FL=1